MNKKKLTSSKNWKNLFYFAQKVLTLHGESYIQTDRVAVCSLLGPVLSRIFMVELENILVPTLSNDLMSWKRYVDDTFIL